MGTRRITDRHFEGASRIGPLMCAEQAAGTHPTTRLFSSKGLRQPQPCDENPLSPKDISLKHSLLAANSEKSSTHMSALSQVQAQPFVLCVLDHTGNFKAAGSPFLQSRLEELISFRFCEQFARVLAEEDPLFSIDTKCKPQFVASTCLVEVASGVMLIFHKT